MHQAGYNGFSSLSLTPKQACQARLQVGDIWQHTQALREGGAVRNKMWSFYSLLKALQLHWSPTCRLQINTALELEEGEHSRVSIRNPRCINMGVCYELTHPPLHSEWRLARQQRLANAPRNLT